MSPFRLHKYLDFFNNQIFQIIPYQIFSIQNQPLTNFNTHHWTSSTSTTEPQHPTKHFTHPKLENNPKNSHRSNCNRKSARKKLPPFFRAIVQPKLGPVSTPARIFSTPNPDGCTHTRHYMPRTQCAREALKHTLARNERYGVCKGRLALPVVLLQRVLGLINCISLRVFNNYDVRIRSCVCVLGVRWCLV